MNEYLVTWKIQLSAETPEEAAAQAKMIQMDTESTANSFIVMDEQTEEITGVSFDGFSLSEVEKTH